MGRDIAVDRRLPRYQWKSYKYGGFIYRLDSLRRLGIANIELKDGEWHPERHPSYPDVYEVTFPFDDNRTGFYTGLFLIALGSGGIKPLVVSAIDGRLLELQAGVFYLL